MLRDFCSQTKGDWILQRQAIAQSFPRPSPHSEPAGEYPFRQLDADDAARCCAQREDEREKGSVSVTLQVNTDPNCA